jgi:hypothetical protein
MRNYLLKTDEGILIDKPREKLIWEITNESKTRLSLLQSNLYQKLCVETVKKSTRLQLVWLSQLRHIVLVQLYNTRIDIRSCREQIHFFYASKHFNTMMVKIEK